MSNIDKRSYRADGGDIGTGRIREIADNLYGDEEKCWLAKRLLALLDELKAAERERDNWRNSFDNERFRADKLAEAFKAEHEQLVMAHGALITQHENANGAEARIAELEALLSAIGKSRPGGVYFNKWASKINEVLNHGK
ncbi:hypothetical protein [Enterobacter oligotrophicus]|uniref:hypothetical protein n=1 Tax=Enterobacter oligotrophicus TaxID=2478464 RepID=UPI001CED9F2C|nr:hypothetical protein [Enterobacter oligotrophicus]